jgi:hypothetical protein
MKKIIKLSSAVMLMSALCVGFVACNEPKDPGQKEEGTEIQPVPTGEVSAEVAAFFQFENLHLIVSSFFDDGKLTLGKDNCVIINSADELPKVDYLGNPIEYPAIDFDYCTLIIGHYAASHGSARLVNQRIFVGSEKITMYISIDETTGGITTFTPKTFYGVYPKLPNLPVSVERK